MSSILRFKYLIVLILIPLILTIIWFRNGLILGGGEEGLIFYNPAKALEISKSTWVEVNTGLPNLYWLPRIPFLLPASILVNNFGLPPYLVQAGLFFILMVIGIVSIYYLTLNLLDKYPSRFRVSFTAAIFYLFNPFSVSQIWGRGLYPLFFSFALLPLSLLLLLKGLKYKQFIYITLIVFSSVIFSNAFGTVTFVITYWLVLFLIFFWWLLRERDKKDKVLFGLFFMILLSIGWVAVSAWWLLPLAIEGNKVFATYLINSGENLGTLMGVSRNFTPDIIIRLLQRTYYFDASAFSPMYRSFFFQLISFIPLIFVLVGFVKIVRKSIFSGFRFYAILLILGLIISLGANPPFGWLFVWIFKQVSFLQAFRNPFEKFGLVYALGYSALFAIGLVGFFENKRFKNFGILIVLLITCGIFAWPMWTGRVVAGIDKKIGVKVPEYYEDLNQWLGNNDSQNYRLFMTPLISGEGAAFEWGNTTYNGVDPMHFILDRSAISNGARIPFYYDFAQSIRKYMDRMDVVPPLSLLRAKYLVAREDAILISSSETEHEEHLTKLIHPAIGVNDQAKVVCEDMVYRSSLTNPVWIVCPISEEDSDWGKVKYLHVIVKTDVSATIEVAVRDINENRPRWDGRADSEYSTNDSELTTLTIPLGAPTEYTNKVNYSNVKIVEVLAHPINFPQSSVNEVQLKGIWLDEGKEEVINEFQLVNQSGKLNLYEPTNFNPAPEYGLISSVEGVNNFKELFQVIQDKRGLIDSRGFILTSQNQSKNTETLSAESKVLVLDKSKISQTRYWLELENGQDGYVILSKTFNPEWKILQNISKDDVKGDFISDLKLLKKTFESEDNHFIINGYANLWAVKNKHSQLAIVFLPQIYADIGSKISLFSLASIFLAWGIIIAVRKRRLWKS